MAVKQTRELLSCPWTLSGQGAADTQLGWGPTVRMGVWMGVRMGVWMRGEDGAIWASEDRHTGWWVGLPPWAVLLNSFHPKP